MRGKIVFGALLASVALCSPGFGFELLDRLLGLENNCESGCGVCAPACNPCTRAKCCPEPRTCAKPCCAPAACARPCCAPAVCAKPCAPAVCAKPCAPAVCARPCCAKVGCEAGCESGCKVRCTPVRDLLCNIKDRVRSDWGPVSCESAGCEGCGESKCRKLYRRPVVELLDSLFSCDRCCDSCCDSCGEMGCNGQCQNGHGSDGGLTPAPAPTAAPAKKSASPIPAAPNPVPIPKPAE
jgi:hypothetical protein